MDDTPTERWNDARQKCQNMGADLAIIRSSNENDFIFGMVKKQTTATYYGVWLGLKQNADSKFYWVDGSPLQGHLTQHGILGNLTTLRRNVCTCGARQEGSQESGMTSSAT